MKDWLNVKDIFFKDRKLYVIYNNFMIFWYKQLFYETKLLQWTSECVYMHNLTLIMFNKLNMHKVMYMFCEERSQKVLEKVDWIIIHLSDPFWHSV